MARGNTLTSAQVDELHGMIYPKGDKSDDKSDDTPAAAPAAPAQLNPAAAPGTTAPAGEPAPEPESTSEAGSGEGQEQPPETPEGAPATAVAGTAALPAAEPRQNGETANWQQRYESLKGKYDTELPQVQAELRNTQEMLNVLSSQKLDLDNLEGDELTPEEIEDYGEELVNMVKRAARGEMGPMLKQLQDQNNALQERLAATMQAGVANSREQLLTTLNQKIPDWKIQNEDQGFIDWLSQSDVYSGLTKQQMLLQAFEANDTNRVIAIFVGYKQEQTGQPPAPPVTSEAQPTPVQKGNGLETLVAPGRPAGTVVKGAQKSGKIWTKGEINDLTRQKIAGKFTPEQAAALDLEWHTAGMEGRIK